MTSRILFVCLGNICRSPAAEAVVRAKSGNRDLVLDSAGTGAWHLGEAPYPPMIRAAAARGYDLSGLRARQFTVEDFHRFDLILAMDRDNLANIRALQSEAEAKAGAATVRLFTEFHDGAVRDVPDPYFTGDFEAVLDLIESCSTGLLRDL